MIAYIVLVVGLLTSFLGFWYSLSLSAEKERLRFEAVAKQTVLLVQNRMDAYRQILYDGAGLFDSFDDVNRAEWAAFVKSMKVNKNFPGIQGIGYSELVKPADKDRHVAKIRAEGFADYAIKPDGIRDIYTSIIYLEPFNERNKRAFGYDMFSEAVRKAAMTKAMESGESAISGKVRLVQENSVDEQAGFLMYVPVYHKNMPLATVEQRRAAIKGFVYAPFRAKDLMSGVLGNRYKTVDLEIYDGEKIEQANLLFDSHDDHKYKSRLTDETQISIDGHTWTLLVKPREALANELESGEEWFVLFSGVVLSLAVFWIIFGLARTREQARELAEKMTEKLSVSEERLKFALEGSGDGVWDWNIKTGEVFFSKRWKEMFGFEEDEIKASLEEWKNRVHPDDLDGVYADLNIHFSGKSKSYANEHRVKCKDGSYKWILDRGLVVLRDADGSPARMVGSHTDITAQKDAERELKKINEHLARLVEEETAKRIEKDKLLIQQSKLATMGEMIGAIGHQWRQPLNSLGLMIQDTLFAYKYGEMNEEYLKRFKDEAMNTVKSMSQTIDDFKNFFSPNKKEEQFFIEDAIAQTIKMLEAQLKNNSVEVIFDVDSTHKHSYVCYKNELNQVILNILANAKDALLEKKLERAFVKIDVSNNNGGCEISIEDSGGGINDDILPKIFEPYFTTKDESKGTGIGLYMSKNIIEDHLGGKLAVENTQNGAKFTIWLPYKEG